MPFVFFNPHEMGGFARFEEGNALAHARVENDGARLGSIMLAGSVESGDHGVKIVAVNPLAMPAEGLPLGFQRIGAEHLR